MRRKALVFVFLFTFFASPAFADTATVQSLTPKAWAMLDGVRENLSVGSLLSQGHSLHTDATGSLNIRFADGSQVILGPSTNVHIKDFDFGGADPSRFHMGITGGMARVITGEVVNHNPEGFKVSTPLATVGIRGTTVDFIVTNDRVSVIVRAMNSGHVVTVTGLDGQSVDITQAGQQVDLLRGNPTPSGSHPASSDSNAPLPIFGAEGDADGQVNLPHRDVGEQQMADMPHRDTADQQAANLPHRDVGEQQIAVAEQQMNVPTAAPQPAPAPLRMVYPAFLMSLPTMAGSPNMSALSADGAVAGFASSNGANYDFYLWSASSGALVQLPSLPTASTPLISASGNGNIVAYSNYNNAVTDVRVYNRASGVIYSNHQPLVGENLAPDFRLASKALTHDGMSMIGTYTSQALGLPAIARWDFNGSQYAQVWVRDSLTGLPISATSSAISGNGNVIGGMSNATFLPTYWVRQGASDSYVAHPIGAAVGSVTVLNNDGVWGAGRFAGPNDFFRINTTSHTIDTIAGLPGHGLPNPTGIANDGQTIVGSTQNTTTLQDTAYLWNASQGMWAISDILTSQGVNLGAAVLNQAHSLSADGQIALCLDQTNGQYYLVRVDGDYLGLTTPSNVYASLAEVAAGATASVISSLPIQSIVPPGGSFSMGVIPAAGDAMGNVLRVWGTGAFMSNYQFNGDDRGFLGGAGATYFMDNGLSLGLGAFYGYRGSYSLYNSRQELDSFSLGLNAGYAPKVTGIRLSLGVMGQDYSLDTRRNYPSGADMASSSGTGSGIGFGLIGHAGWVFALTEELTVQPFAEYTWQYTRTPEYAEQGGPFPASYDAQGFTQNITRLGLDAQWDISPTLNLQAWLAWNHRFESEGPASSGQVIGWQPFFLNGAELKQDWGDTGLGFRWRFLDNTTLGVRVGFGIDNKDSGLPDVMSSMSLSVDI